MIYLDKFHEPRYEDAGDCFVFARSWYEAAKLYALGNCLLKCLSACREGLHFDLGFNFLKKWPQSVSDSDWVDYTKSTVSAYHRLNDIDTLWKFVKAFPKDLVSLLLASNDFGEALAIARLKGEFLLEADILQKTRQYEDSARLMLFCAVEMMLWENGNTSWPLKPPVLVGKIITKAKSLASLASSNAMKYVCSEADLLEGSSADIFFRTLHINNGKTSATMCEDLFASRSVLDICLQTNVSKFYQEDDTTLNRGKSCSVPDMLFEGYVSVQVLLFSWNLWKTTVQGMMVYLQSFGTPDVSKYTEYGELCMKYFGVRKLDLKGVYVCMNGRASWIIRWDNEQRPHVDEKFTYIYDTVFNSLAIEHFKSEIQIVGELVLKKLQELHRFLSSPRCSVVQRGVIAHQFGIVLSFLKQYGFQGTSVQHSNFEKDLIQFRSFVFATFFPLVYDISMALEQLSSSLEDPVTKLVAIVLDNNFGTVFDQFEPMKFARVLVFLLNHRVSGNLYQKTRDILVRERSWSQFFHGSLKLRPIVSRHATPLVEKFLALSNLDLQNQLLLLEHILFFASLGEISRGWFLTSRISLSRFVFSKESVSDTQLLKQSLHASPVLEFLLATARELMFMSGISSATRGKSNKVVKNFRLLLMRTVALLGLICLNSPKHFPKVKEMLGEADGVLVGLPEEFLWNFWDARKMQSWALECFGAALSRSMESAGNRLVVVHLDRFDKSLDYLKPLYFKYSDLLQCRERAVDACAVLTGEGSVKWEFS